MPALQHTKKVKSNPKTAKLKRSVRPRNDCDGRLNSKNFNNDNSGKFVLPSPFFTRIRHQDELLLLKFLLLSYYHSHMVFLGAAHFFTAGLFLD